MLPSMNELTPETLEEAAALLETCNRHDGLDIPIYLDDLTSGRVHTAFPYRDDAGAMIGFAALPDDPEPEGCLMVHPEHRRRRIGRGLVDEMRAELRRRGLAECLLVTDAVSPSAQPFLEALAIPYRFSEYRLELDRAAIDRSRPRHETLILRPATEADADLLVTILAAAFAESEIEARANVEITFREPSRRFYLAELAGEPIGAIRAGEWGGNGDTTAFGVAPAHQGKGYGRQILLETVDLLIEAGHARILLEVAVDNPSALGLYQSCGFRVINEFGYYGLSSQ
jgi:ribosomal protein S18 acetylase RimI-like enzyme